MMFPVTKNLLIINALLFFATYVAQKYRIDIINYLGLHFFLAGDFKFFQLFTYMFMHGSFSHVFFNMFAVWMFGNLLERTWGSSRFLFFYIVCGLGAGVVQEIVQFINYEWVLSKYTNVDTGSGIISLNEYLNFLNTVGASGAVYGILLAFGMLYPNEKMYIFPLPVPLKAKYFVMGYAVIELLLAIINNPTDNVAHFAHLGGMAFGFILIKYWKKKNINNDRTYY